MRGLVAAVVTPMNEKGDLNLNLVPKVVDYLATKGITGIYIAGSTGEGMSLTDEERREVAEAYVFAAKGRMKSFVQVGHNSLKASADLQGMLKRLELMPFRQPQQVTLKQVVKQSWWKVFCQLRKRLPKHLFIIIIFLSSPA